jgi:hypothetical protein
MCVFHINDENGDCSSRVYLSLCMLRCMSGMVISLIACLSRCAHKGSGSLSWIRHISACGSPTDLASPGDHGSIAHIRSAGCGMHTGTVWYVIIVVG